MELKAEGCLLGPCHGCPLALCCRELFGLNLVGKHQIVVPGPRCVAAFSLCCSPDPGEPSHGLHLLPYTAVPCLWWLCPGAVRHCLDSVGDIPGCGALSWGHCPWCWYSLLRLPRSFWRTAGVAFLGFVHRCSLLARTQRRFLGQGRLPWLQASP